jgi:hypothetical protein
MTPEQKIKHLILLRFAELDRAPIAEEITADNIDRLYEETDEKWDAISEVREGEVETHLPGEYSRHYESKQVAAKAPDGSWVGWTYWYGGGKHGEPESIDWMDEAYDVICVEEEKTVVVQTFAKAMVPA